MDYLGGSDCLCLCDVSMTICFKEALWGCLIGARHEEVIKKRQVRLKHVRIFYLLCS